MIHPLLLGSGQRRFEPDDQPVQLRLLDGTATATAILASYQPA